MYTAHHDIKHCFEETVSKGTDMDFHSRENVSYISQVVELNGCAYAVGGYQATYSVAFMYFVQMSVARGQL